MIRYDLTELKRMGVVYDVETYGPLDTRLVVYSYSSLFDSATWVSDGTGNYYIYNGMMVAVAEDSDETKNGIYVLIDSNAKISSDSPATPDFSTQDNWHKLCDIGDLNDLNTDLSDITERVNQLEQTAGNDMSEDQVNALIAIQISALKDELSEIGYVTEDEIANYAKTEYVDAEIAKLAEDLEQKIADSKIMYGTF